jgi:gluconokinase
VPAVVVMGVSGSGKTTVGQRLAELLTVPYADGDSFHSPESVAKMSSGQPLTDADRAPWLASIGRWLSEHPAGSVASCSALRRRYRDALGEWVPDIFFVHLAGDPATVASRVGARRNHFMPATLVSSQFAELEPLGAGESGVTLDLEAPAGQNALAAYRAFESYVSGLHR